MAKTCALCNSRLSQSFPLSFELRNILVCSDCYSIVNQVRKAEALDKNAQAKNLSYMQEKWVNISEPEAKKYADSVKEKFLALNAEAVAAAEARRIADELKSQIILTTAPSVEGYRIIEHCGLVFGETVFKSSFFGALGKSFEDFGNSLNFDSTEMTGIVSLLDEARDFAVGKMTERAAQRGCNAVIGIDSESSEVGGGIHMTIYGTAVKIEKL